MALGMSAQAAALQNQLRYSRAFEQEADRVGMQTLTQAGYDPRAMPDFFLKLERATRQLGYMPEFLLTHPLSTTRLS
ncbi:M48 family metalloprotease, partial [Acinetobacter baumannii]